MKRAWAVGLAGSVLVTACGGNSKKAAAPATTAQVTTTTAVATVSQIASIVAARSADIRRYAAAAKTCEVLIDSHCGQATKISASTLVPTAQILDNELRAAGSYPPELVKLVAGTRAAIAEIASAGDAITKAGCNPAKSDDGCAAPFLLLAGGASSLVRQLDAWSPYTH
jgi:hypothetical protein